MKLLRELTSDIEARLKKAVFVGRLTTVEDLANSMLEPVKEDSHEFLNFHIKCLTDLPDEISQQVYIYLEETMRILQSVLGEREYGQKLSQKIT